MANESQANHKESSKIARFIPLLGWAPSPRAPDGSI